MNEDSTFVAPSGDAEGLEISISGGGVEMTLVLTDQEYLIGRALEAEIHLPDAAVSRRHARFSKSRGDWFIEDLGSRHGTEIGGARIVPSRPVGIGPGERIVIRPYVIRVKGEHQERTTLFSHDDSARLMADSVSAVPEAELEVLASRRLGLLMDSAASIQKALDEDALADAALDATLAGTDFGRAFLLRSVLGVDRIQMLGSRVRVGMNQDTVEDPISRTLLQAAGAGRVVRLRDEPDIQAAVSIVGAGVKEALCVPIRVGEEINAYLYLDASASSGSDGSDAAAFCSAVGRLCGLALSNMQRVDLEKQQQQLVQELEAAQMVQRRMAPPETGSMGGLRWNVRVVPGTIVAGDLVCACSAPNGDPIVFLGDVAGKGAAAGLLMAALEARIIAESERGAPPSEMVRNANRAIMRVTDAAEFITLWTIRFDVPGSKAHCVDSGHGYCAIVRSNGVIERVSIDGGPPVGVVGPPTTRRKT
jgi:pSer/pThr/pTyr-binding forkhead associated (FHA) protein